MGASSATQSAAGSSYPPQGIPTLTPPPSNVPQFPAIAMPQGGGLGALGPSGLGALGPSGLGALGPGGLGFARGPLAMDGTNPIQGAAPVHLMAGPSYAPYVSTPNGGAPNVTPAAPPQTAPIQVGMTGPSAFQGVGAFANAAAPVQQGSTQPQAVSVPSMATILAQVKAQQAQAAQQSQASQDEAFARAQETARENSPGGEGGSGAG
jgi:hypothetical protein